MQAVQLPQLDLISMWSESDPTRAARFTFPIFSATGAASSSVVYFEIDPGKHLGMHRDSAEEVVAVLSGEAEALVGDARGRVSAGGIALVPSMVPHDIVNIGEEKVRVLGFFSSATVVSIFEDALAPIGRQVVGTPLPEEPAAVYA